MPCAGGKALLGLDTQRGFGAGQGELLSWEVTVVAALCPVSCLATCFPLGDGTLGLKAAGAGHTGRRQLPVPRGVPGAGSMGWHVARPLSWHRE